MKYRVMHTYESHGRTVDECVKEYDSHSPAYAHVLQLTGLGYNVWLQEREV